MFRKVCKYVNIHPVTQFQVYPPSNKCHINTPFLRVRCQIKKLPKSQANTFYAMILSLRSKKKQRDNVVFGKPMKRSLMIFNATNPLKFVCVCLAQRERESVCITLHSDRDRECVCVSCFMCACRAQRQKVCVCVLPCIQTERESVCACCVHVWLRERESVCVLPCILTEREYMCACLALSVCKARHTHTHTLSLSKTHTHTL